MSELVSIVVPVYNMVNYLPRCIDSILGQTYKNLQIILVNDGSTDGSLMICKEYALRDNRITVIDRKNGGLSDARNAGIIQAKGVYIAFIDSDDYVHTRYIQYMYECIKRDGSDICVCNYLYVNEGEEDLDAINQEPEHSDFHLEGLYPTNIALKAISDYNMVVVWNKLYPRYMFDKVKFPVGRLHEDEFVLHRLFALCKSVSIIPEKLYYYMQQPDSIMRRPYTARRLDALDAFDDRMWFYLEHKDYDMLKFTCSTYIRWYVMIHKLLPTDNKDVSLRWKECTKKLLSHYKTMLMHGGALTCLRFLLAVISPGTYNAIRSFCMTIKKIVNN